MKYLSCIIPDDGLGMKAETFDETDLFQLLMTNLSTVGTMSNNSHTTVDNQPRTSLKQYLRTGYNETTRLEVRMYEPKLHSRAKLHSHLIFSLRCRNKGLMKDEQQKINSDEGENLPKVWISTLRLVCLALQ